MSWSITQTIPTMATPDLPIGIAFYERLGFEVDWTWPEDGPTHAGLRRGDCAIMLCRCAPNERADVYFIVDDVEACHDTVIKGACWELAPEAGALANRADCPPKASLEAPRSPEATPYGLRDFSVVDPWGHQITFGQPLE